MRVVCFMLTRFLRLCTCFCMSAIIFYTGMGSASMGGMMGMDNHPALNPGNMHNEMPANQKKDDHSMRQVLTQGGLDRPPNDIHPGQLGNQNIRSLSPTTLNMLRAGGLSNAQGSQPSYNVLREQQCLDAGISGMYGGDRMMNQQLHGGMHGPQYGLNHPSNFGQFGGPWSEGGQGFMQNFGRSSGFPPNGNAPIGEVGFDDDVHAQILRMQSRNQGSQGDNHNKTTHDL